MKSDNVESVTVNFPKGMKEKIMALAKKDDRSMNSLIVSTMRKLLEQSEQK